MTPPRLLLIADHFASAGEGVLERAEAAVRAGTSWVQLRDHDADPETFARQARQVADRLRRVSPDVLISVNTHVDVARELGAGLHVGRRGPSFADARERLGDGLLSAAVHSVDEAAAAVSAGADVLVFAPVYPTASKPGQPGADLEALQAVCAAAGKTPVLALGGLRPERVGECLSAGAHGVAFLSVVMDAAASVVPVIVCAFEYALQQWQDELHETSRPHRRGR